MEWVFWAIVGLLVVVVAARLGARYRQQPPDLQPPPEPERPRLEGAQRLIADVYHDQHSGQTEDVADKIVSSEAGTRYRLLNSLRVGESDVVYTATSVDKERVDATVRILMQTRWDRRFLKEIKACQGVRHPAVARILDWGLWQTGEARTVPFVVTPFISGRRLSDVLPPLEPAQVMDIVGQALDALAALHAVGSTHGRVRATNMVLPSTGGFKLMDCGLAAFCPGASTEGDIAALGQVAGSLLNGHPSVPEPLAQLLGGMVQGRYSEAAQVRSVLTALVEPARPKTPAPLATPGAVKVGSRLGRYTLNSVLGSGGAASVYEGLTETGDRVAVKVIHNTKVTDEARARFNREIEICRALDHPNLVRLLDWGTDDLLYLVMELVVGTTVRALITPTGMPVAEVHRWLGGVAAGLSHAHSRGVVHCDLKPDNVMLTLDGRVRVMDFGIATCRGLPRLTMTTDVLGTPGYLAPEQLDGVRNDPRTDQYAVGVMVFHCLTGTPPFFDADLRRMMVRQMVEDAPLLHTMRPDVDEAFSQAVARMLAKTPEERFETLDAAWGALAATVDEAGATRIIHDFGKSS